jgi:F-type H+-transporting ATPase subunit delta
MSSDNRLIATRYVQALFDLATQDGQHDAVKADMEKFKSILSGSPEFGKLLINPVISRASAEKAIGKVLLGIKASELTRKFFIALARNRR